MGLPLHTRAAALAVAVATTGIVIDLMAEIGHPSPDGLSVISWLTPASPRAGATNVATTRAPETSPPSFNMPQP